jgi:tape measure domain-containing protein
VATLQNRIELVDGVSPALNKITQSVNATQKGFSSIANSRKVFDQLEQSVSGVERVVDSMQGKRINIKTNAIQTVTGVRQVINSLQDKIINIRARINIPSVNIDLFTPINDAMANLQRQINNISRAFSRLKGLVSSTFGQMTMANLAAGAIAKIGSTIASLPAYLIHTSDTYAGIEARLRLIVGEGGDVEAMNQRIYESAIRARGSYFQMADAVGKIAMTAKEAFPDPQQVVPFMEGIQKLFTIGGTGVQQQADALLQLTQALGSGKLQGDEFRSIAEAAPMIEQMVAEYMNVSRGALKQLSSDGQITSEILKNAILQNMDKINEMFEQMPLTWGSIWQIMTTQATNALKPVFSLVSDLANTPVAKIIMDTAIQGIQLAASALEWLINNLVWIAKTPVIQTLAMAVQGLVGLLVKAGNAIGETYRAMITPIQKLADEWTPRLTNEFQWFINTPIGGAIVASFIIIIGVISEVLDIGAQLTGWFLDTLPTAINYLTDIVMIPFQMLYDAVAGACEGLNIFTEIALPALLTVLTIAGGALLIYSMYWLIANASAIRHAVVMELVAARTAICNAAMAAWRVVVMAATIASWLFHGSILATIVVIGAIISIIAYGAISIFRKWQDATGRLGTTFESVFSSIGQIVSDTINFMIDKINGFIGVLNTLAGAINSIFGTNIGMIGEIGWRADFAGSFGAAGKQVGDTIQDVSDFLENPLEKLKQGMQNGNNGKTIQDSQDGGGGSDGTGGSGGDGGAAQRTADNTGRMADAMDDIIEIAKEARELASKEAVLHYTTQEIAVSVGDINPTIEKQQDVDGVIDQITEYILTGINTGAEAVHV